jgi:hypothetical protein
MMIEKRFNENGGDERIFPGECGGGRKLGLLEVWELFALGMRRFES